MTKSSARKIFVNLPVKDLKKSMPSSRRLVLPSMLSSRMKRRLAW